MISFPETLDALERLAELLKSASEVESALDDAVDDLTSFHSMLKYPRERNLEEAQAVLDFIENVLTPQLLGIKDSLVAGTEEHLKRLKIANDQAERLAIRLRMVVNGDIEDYLT